MQAGVGPEQPDPHATSRVRGCKMMLLDKRFRVRFPDGLHPVEPRVYRLPGGPVALSAVCATAESVSPRAGAIALDRAAGSRRGHCRGTQEHW